MHQPVWMAEAWRHLGMRERAGSQSAPGILDFFKDAGHGDVRRDEVPWCAAFAGACLARAGEKASGSLLARSYLDWGNVIEQPRLGAVAVLSRGEPWAGHVGFWLGETGTDLILLGGNQGDAVTVAAFPKARLLGYRWPASRPAAPAPVNTRPWVPADFEAALVHVLEMEGGFTDDPDDPGGPTNKGITLAVFARHMGRAVLDATRGDLVDRLRRIEPAVVREIYAARYWRPSRAGEMAPALALMHFDASVNHGLTGAAKLLQQALNRRSAQLDVDGEIGHLTMAAARAADTRRLVEDYAVARRERYRALPHFWKFGRGWLNRVAKTLARTETLSAVPPPPRPDTETNVAKGRKMTVPNIPLGPVKWWGQSMTIWGAVITALSTVVPVLGPAVGIDVTPEIVRKAGEQVVAIVQAIGGLVGTALTIYGRARALQSLERRQVSLNL